MPPLPLEPKGNRVLLAGRGDELLGLVLRHAPARQWTLWLHLPLIGAAADGDVDFVKDLFAAGASGGAGQRGEDGCTLVGFHTNNNEQQRTTSSVISHAAQTRLRSKFTI